MNLFGTIKSDIGLISRMFNAFQGRTTFFAVAILTIGSVLAFMGKLTSNFVALAGVIQALAVAHSAKDDWYAQKMFVEGSIKTKDADKSA